MCIAFKEVFSMVSRRKVVGVVGVGAIAALAYYYGPKYLPDGLFNSNKNPPVTTTTGKPNTTATLTTKPPITTTKHISTTTPPTTITPPPNPRNMMSPVDPWKFIIPLPRYSQRSHMVLR